MTEVYSPPGVTVTEIPYQQVSPILGSSNNVCLIGLSQGYQTHTDQIVLPKTGEVVLPFLQTLKGSKLTEVTSVINALEPNKSEGGYKETTDFTVDTEKNSIARVEAGKIEENATVIVTYRYMPENYFSPIRLNDQGAVESRFGSAFNTSGTAINSALSFAASMAFQNGAQSVICQPLFARATPGDPTTAQKQPTTEAAEASATWEDTLYILRGIQNINFIVPITGANELAIFEAVQNHQAFMATQEEYPFGFFGQDYTGKSENATMAKIREHAETLKDRYGGVYAQQAVLIDKAAYGIPAPGGNISELVVGGQYFAAALAGAVAARPVSSGMTRKIVAGFTSDRDPRLLSDKNIDAEKGLMVTEQVGNVVRIRQQLTLDLSNSSRAELSVVRAKFVLIQSIKETIENQIIGNIIADGNSPYVVSSTISGVLALLQENRDIVEYSQVNASISSTNPTVITANFSYRPAFPLNYVDVSFNVNLTSNTVELNGENTENTEASL